MASIGVDGRREVTIDSAGGVGFCAVGLGTFNCVSAADALAMAKNAVRQTEGNSAASR